VSKRIRTSWDRALATIATLAVALPAWGQSSAEGKALAVQLFDEAERLVAAGDFAHACPKYAESQRLDPQLGVLLYLADCYEKNGQLASAWGSFRAATELAEQRGDARTNTSRQRAEALALRVSQLEIDVPAEARRPGLVVKRDGTTVVETLWGSAVAVDPGTHRVTVEAPHFKSFAREVAVTGEGTLTRISIGPLEPEPVETKRSEPGSVGSPTPSDGSTQRIAAIGVGGLGLVGIAVGGFFGLSAQSSASDSNDLCNAKNICTAAGHDLRDRAKSRALVATIATGIGTATLAGAAVLWFTAPSSPKQLVGRLLRPRVGLRPEAGGARLLLDGHF